MGSSRMEASSFWDIRGNCRRGVGKCSVSLRRSLFQYPTPFWVLLGLCILSSFCQSISAAYFYVQESQDKCFMENVPLGVALTASYKNHENPGRNS